MVEEEGLEFDILESRRVNCTLMALGQHDRYKNVLTCPAYFDGWSCWPETPAGSSQVIYT
ncbi:unnamed protein product [Acanthoscelides obtectus]|uniref:G-protein coupled receptors family 2 profile 1 domain-containing protein n=1 Tax=Acanthoscelides obtectus TaxID=200917 RepID=A0A9P0M146_ACAOB|nr:unnamed protein product [Acanthoscelides obtectus]CAK1669080.1 hypothetical protein AOBTE_LOCUS26781 [Acanthoscelides obtectus]